MLVLLWPIELSAEVPLCLEGCLVFVNAKLLEQVIKVVLEKAFEHFELHHVIVILCIS